MDADRPRPTVHFTAAGGWINDPHGICWDGTRYHLFFQHCPDATSWAPNCHWGHAISPDLVRWERRPVALAPHAAEVGCWSGTTLVEAGSPTILYTSAPADNWGHGRIAVARPDESRTRWSSTEADIVIDGPPDHLGASDFRDPCIVRTDDGWAMIVGVGVPGGMALAVQYTSTDARTWLYTGVLCSRSTTEREGTWTGSLWECPQLFRVGVDWVLVVSAWESNVLHYVAGAVGTYDGTVFTPERWCRLTHDDISYAATSFVDNQGRPCLMTWLRESVEQDSDWSSWAGALSLPMLVGITADRKLQLLPHPDVATLRTSTPVHDGPPDENVQLETVDSAMDIEADLGAGHQLSIVTTDDHGRTTSIKASAEARVVTVCRPGDGTKIGDPVETVTTMPMPDGHLRVVVDADLIEIFSGDGVAVRRTKSAGRSLTISGRAERLTVHRLQSVRGLDAPPPTPTHLSD